jgi:hypothetical protein
MVDSPYVRSNLAATQARIPDPTVEVECRLDRLEEVLALAGSPLPPTDCYDLLAIWAWLRRLRPEFLVHVGAEVEAAAAAQAVREGGEELARQALSVPNPTAWLQEARDLEAAYDEAADPVARSALAERLLTDLDDAELVAYAAERCGLVDAALEKELTRCRAWLADHADLFLAASVHVQAVAQALRPELAELDYGLALTALKYERLLDEAEAAEEALAVKRVSSLPSQEVAEAARQFRQEREAARALLAVGLLLNHYRRALRRPAAFSGSPQEPAAETVIKWVSPGRDMVAYLPLPGESEEAWTVAFYTASGEAASHLAGEPVFLDGVPARVTPSASANFTGQDLAAVSELGLCLEVGADRTRWELQEG